MICCVPATEHYLYWALGLVVVYVWYCPPREPEADSVHYPESAFILCHSGPQGACFQSQLPNVVRGFWLVYEGL